MNLPGCDHCEMPFIPMPARATASSAGIIRTSALHSVHQVRTEESPRLMISTSWVSTVISVLLCDDIRLPSDPLLKRLSTGNLGDLRRRSKGQRNELLTVEALRTPGPRREDSRVHTPYPTTGQTVVPGLSRPGHISYRRCAVALFEGHSMGARRPGRNSGIKIKIEPRIENQVSPRNLCDMNLMVAFG